MAKMRISLIWKSVFGYVEQRSKFRKELAHIQKKSYQEEKRMQAEKIGRLKAQGKYVHPMLKSLMDFLKKNNKKDKLMEVKT